MRHLLLLLPLSSSNATTPCSPSDTSQLDSLAASRAGLLRVCHNDAGFDLYPFTGFPPADKATIVCFGRACPSVIYDLQHAALPNCTVDVQGQAMTPAEYLQRLCPSSAPATTTTTTTTTTSSTTGSSPETSSAQLYHAKSSQDIASSGSMTLKSPPDQMLSVDDLVAVM